ncbi:MAG: hypothetical protein ACPL7O_08210, partial [Armatimonadota bacterium]
MTWFVRINKPTRFRQWYTDARLPLENLSAPGRSSFKELRISERTPSDALFGSCIFPDISDHNMLLLNSTLLIREHAEAASMVISSVSVSAFTPWQDASTTDKPTAIMK